MDVTKEEVLLLLDSWRSDGRIVECLLFTPEANCKLVGKLTSVSPECIELEYISPRGSHIGFVQLRLTELALFECAELREVDERFRPAVETAVSSVVALTFSRDRACLLFQPKAKPAPSPSSTILHCTVQ